MKPPERGAQFVLPAAQSGPVPLQALSALYLARAGQAFELVVRTGVTVDGQVALLEPLDEKTIVIRRPPPGLRDGASITTTTAALTPTDTGDRR